MEATSSLDQRRWVISFNNSRVISRGRPSLTYRFEDTIIWERWHFWRSENNYRLIQCIRGLCSSDPCPCIFKLSLQVPWIDSSIIIVEEWKYALECWRMNLVFIQSNEWQLHAPINIVKNRLAHVHMMAKKKSSHESQCQL